MPFPAMPTAVKCPQCDADYVVQVHAIIDIGQEPELKEQFLRGEINYAECPQCGNGGMLSTPIVYHDPSKELLVSYVPSTLQMGADQREQIVGGLVQAIMNSLPQEERKAYLLQPKTALTMDSLFDTIWEADGVSKEFLQERRAKLQLINDLLAAREDDERLEVAPERDREQGVDDGHREREAGPQRAGRLAHLRVTALEGPCQSREVGPQTREFLPLKRLDDLADRALRLDVH